MTDQTPTTVAVPLELLKELIEIVSFHKGSTPAGRQAAALLPKPKPRLVAVDLDWVDGAAEVDLPAHLDRLPDLLTLLDEAIEGNGFFHPTTVRIIKARIRTALGVTE